MTALTWIVLGLSVYTTNIINCAPEPKRQAEPQNELICIASDQITALQAYLQQLAANAETMKTTMAEHVNDTEADPAVMATWLDLIKLHLTVNSMYDNFTEWVQSHGEAGTNDVTYDVTDDITYDVTDDKRSDSANQIHGFAIFNLWTQLHQLKGNITQMQLNSKYYELKLGNLTALQKGVADLNKRMEKMERGQLMYTNTLADMKQQVHNMDSKINRSENVRSLNTEEMVTENNHEDALVSIQETVISLMERMATVQNLTNSMAAEMDKLKLGLSSERNILGPVSTSEENHEITFANCNDERRHLLGNSCYYIPRLQPTDELYTWWDARHYCRHALGQGADLAAIENEQEMLDIINLLSNHFGGIQEIWLGGSDLQLEGTWVWSSSKKALNEHSYDNWAHPPPYNTASNCMSMLRGYEWVDEPCFYERYPLCELPLQPE